VQRPGIRKQDVHWTFGISTSGATLESVRFRFAIIFSVAL
jgi:hypothetical protein